MAIINPRSLFQTFLNAPKPRAIVYGAGVSGGTAAQGVGIWNINPSTTYNGNTNSVPVVIHNVKSSSVAALVYPEFDDTVLWFDATTAAIIGFSTYGSNKTNTTSLNIGIYDWYLDATKTLALPTSADVTYTSVATVWTSSNVTLSHKRGVRFTGWEDYDPYAVGASFSLTTGYTVRASASLATVGIANTLQLRYTITLLLNGTPVVSADNPKIYDFFFNTTGFAYADFPERVLVKQNNGTYVKTPIRMRWTKVSGF